MIQFSDKEIKLIEEKCGRDYVLRYKGIVKRNAEKVVKVVNTGMVSSGKSSLFNVLIDSTEEEHFPTGAARTTKIADYFDYKNISFIDTPGFDVRSEDDDLAFRTIMEADLILMVHNIRMGPINRSEAEWLDKIVKRMNSKEMCKSRLLFVCTWKDTREQDEDYENIVNDVKQQVFEIVGTEIPFFEISVKKYLNGVKKNRNILKKNSGILELKKFLENYAVEYVEKKTAVNEEEMLNLLSEIRSMLLDEKGNANQRLDKIRQTILNKYKSCRITWGQVYTFFKTKRNQLSSLQEEYRNI